jgi:hypothetical protein
LGGKMGEYIAKNYIHLKKKNLWAQRGPNFILQVNKPPKEGNQKMV